MVEKRVSTSARALSGLMPSWSCDRVRIGPNKFPPEIAIDAPTANIAASRCRGCFSGHYEHIGGAWDHHRPRVVPFPKRVKKTWPSTAYSFAPPDPFVPIQVPTPTYLGPARGWSRWRGVPGRYYGNPFCLSGPKSTAPRRRLGAGIRVLSVDAWRISVRAMEYSRRARARPKQNRF